MSRLLCLCAGKDAEAGTAQRCSPTINSVGPNHSSVSHDLQISKSQFVYCIRIEPLTTRHQLSVQSWHGLQQVGHRLDVKCTRENGRRRSAVTLVLVLDARSPSRLLSSVESLGCHRPVTFTVQHQHLLLSDLPTALVLGSLYLIWDPLFLVKLNT